MSQVWLGRITLHWCPRCDVPLVEKVNCGLCGGPPKAVALTPPGDARPAFPFDIGMVRALADAGFGIGAGRRLVPDSALVLLNRIPDLDRTDEVIVGGEVAANLAWVLGRGFVLQLRMPGARMLWGRTMAEGAAGELKGWVVADGGAVPSILEGSNLLGPGVAKCAPGILPGDEVMVFEDGPDGRALLGTGNARMSSENMAALSRGNAVKVRWKREKTGTGEGAEGPHPRPPIGRGGTDAPAVPVEAAKGPAVPGMAAGSRDWDDVLAANKRPLERARAKAVEFIKEGIAKLGKEAAVSYSGGKDSLATLLLVLDAGVRPKVLFIDTGLEFPETVENAVSTARLLGLELLREDACEAFWENLPKFGPPGRDARWCCKCCKLGPVARLISREFPGGVVSFIGQRRYESEARSSKGPVWKNPWVPGQIGASPIQDWTALQVWLYIFSKKVPYNPWYERGLDRIGCFLCPATNLADLELVRKAFPGYQRWEERLQALPPVYREFGLWRWRRIPRGVQEHLAQRGITPEAAPVFPPRLSLETKAPFPCESGFELEGQFSRKLDLEAVAGRLRALGRTQLEGDCLVLGDWAELFRDGRAIIRGADEEELKRRVETLGEAVVRSEECAGCGSCTGRCRTGAASIRKGRMVVDAEKCTQCGACLTGPCPATTYSPETQDDV